MEMKPFLVPGAVWGHPLHRCPGVRDRSSAFSIAAPRQALGVLLYLVSDLHELPRASCSHSNAALAFDPLGLTPVISSQTQFPFEVTAGTEKD